MILILISWLIFKHFVVDFLLQPPYMYKNKGTYGHFGGIAHSGFHAIVTLAILYPFLGLGQLSISLAITECIVHYHIDWAKVNITKKTGWGPTTSEYYWWLLGFDQFLHYATYIFIVWETFN